VFATTSVKNCVVRSPIDTILLDAHLTYLSSVFPVQYSWRERSWPFCSSPPLNAWPSSMPTSSSTEAIPSVRVNRFADVLSLPLQSMHAHLSTCCMNVRLCLRLRQIITLRARDPSPPDTQCWRAICTSGRRASSKAASCLCLPVVCWYTAVLSFSFHA